MSQLRTQEPVAASLPGTIDLWLLRHSDRIVFLLVAAGFLLRLKAASGTFLNPDEALHFAIANQSSLAAAYRASLTLAHPPLLIVVLHFWRTMGTSELVLRLPSVIAGSAFCWIFFQWLKTALGTATALVGVIFMALLPPMVVLSAEVRQYSLLLLFMACAALLLERALEKTSGWRMALASLSLWLAMLSHYSGLLFAAAFGLYSLVRVVRDHPPAKVVGTWLAGQVGAVVGAIFLYVVQISRLQGGSLAQQAISEWLRRSYFHRGQDNLLAFVFGRSFAVFQFVFGQLLVGDIAGLLFLAGVLFMLQGRFPERISTSARQFGIFLLLPFAVNGALAVVDRYPYGGTRHSVFLSMFALAGIGACLVTVTRGRFRLAVALAAFLVAICYAFGFHHQPYIPREDQSRSRMEQTMQFIRAQIPSVEPIFVDYETNLMLGHYLCGQKPAVIDVSGFQSFHCAQHEIISAPPHFWMFGPDSFPQVWDDLVGTYDLKAGSHVWVVRAGWGAAIAPGLEHKRSDITPAEARSFGRNLSAFRLTVAQKSTGPEAPSR